MGESQRSNGNSLDINRINNSRFIFIRRPIDSNNNNRSQNNVEENARDPVSVNESRNMNRNISGLRNAIDQRVNYF